MGRPASPESQDQDHRQADGHPQGIEAAEELFLVAQAQEGTRFQTPSEEAEEDRVENEKDPEDSHDEERRSQKQKRGERFSFLQGVP